MRLFAVQVRRTRTTIRKPSVFAQTLNRHLDIALSALVVSVAVWGSDDVPWAWMPLVEAVTITAVAAIAVGALALRHVLEHLSDDSVTVRMRGRQLELNGFEALMFLANVCVTLMTAVRGLDWWVFAIYTVLQVVVAAWFAHGFPENTVADRAVRLFAQLATAGWLLCEGFVGELGNGRNITERVAFLALIVALSVVDMLMTCVSVGLLSRDQPLGPWLRRLPATVKDGYMRFKADVAEAQKYRAATLAANTPVDATAHHKTPVDA